MIYCRNALGEPSSLDFHHFFVVSEMGEEVPVETGGSFEMGLGMCGTLSRIGGYV
jgi:hypothetical protein